MSGHRKGVTIDRGIAEKAFAFIPRPLLANELLYQVREKLDG